MIFTILICLMPAMSLAAILGDSTSLQQNSASAIAKRLVASPGKDSGSRIKRVAVAATPEDQSVRFKKIMKLIEAGKLQDCAGRVVCDLNCDPARYGASGAKVLAMMNKVTEAGVMDVEDMQLLVTAGVSGRMYYWTSGCTRCRDGYPDCFTDSGDLIDVASIFDVDSL